MADGVRHPQRLRGDEHRLGHPERGRDRRRVEPCRGEALREGGDRCRSHRLAARDEASHGRQVEVGNLCVGCEFDAQIEGEVAGQGERRTVRGHELQPRHRSALELLGRGEHDLPAVHRRHEHLHHQAHRVMQRQPAHERGGLVRGDELRRRVCRRAKGAVRSHHTLRIAGRSRGEEQPGDRVGVDRGRHPRVGVSRLEQLAEDGDRDVDVGRCQHGGQGLVGDDDRSSRRTRDGNDTLGDHRGRQTVSCDRGRDEGCAGVECPKEGVDPSQSRAQRDDDAIPDTDALPGQCLRDGAGASIEVAVAAELRRVEARVEEDAAIVAVRGRGGLQAVVGENRRKRHAPDSFVMDDERWRVGDLPGRRSLGCGVSGPAVSSGGSEHWAEP